MMPKNNRFYLVYGNHGASPFQLDDYATYLTLALRRLGKELLLTQFPVPGAANILVEGFDSEFYEKIVVASEQPGTKFILIATEFITGDTFNDFFRGEAHKAIKGKAQVPRWSKIIVNSLSPIFAPHMLRSLMLELVPRPYMALREVYYSLFGYPIGSYYQIKQYWLDRFVYCSRVINVCEAVWCVSPHQMPNYVERFGSKVKLMPMVNWETEITNASQGKFEKDIDFLFTGSLTPYRSAILQELQKRGYNVVIGPATWPNFMRDHFIARAKVCLQIKQDPNWQYPSIMRYHHLLCSGAVVVAEMASEACDQETYLVTAKSEDFLAACEQTIKEGQFLARGRSAFLNYTEGSAAGRTEFAKLIPTYEGHHEQLLESRNLDH